MKREIRQELPSIVLPDVFVYKGEIDVSSNPNYPAAMSGWVYKISVAGKIGGASGLAVDAGDTLFCHVDDSPAGTQAAVGANWGIQQGNLDFETAVANIKMNGSASVGTEPTVPRADHVHPTDTSREAANANIQSHISSTSNPHGVTAGQAGADPAGSASQAETNAKNASILRTTDVQAVDETAIADGHIVIFDKTAKTMKSSGKTLADMRLGNLIYCDNSRTDTYTPDGSQQYPFKTLISAVTDALTNGKETIFLMTGNYSESIIIDDSLITDAWTLRIVGMSRKDCIIGVIDITHGEGNEASLTLENLTVTGDANTAPIFVSIDEINLQITNCDITGQSTNGNNAIESSRGIIRLSATNSLIRAFCSNLGNTDGAILIEEEGALHFINTLYGVLEDDNTISADKYDVYANTGSTVEIESDVFSSPLSGRLGGTGDIAFTGSDALGRQPLKSSPVSADRISIKDSEDGWQAREILLDSIESRERVIPSSDGDYNAKNGTRTVTVDENTVGVGGVLVLSADGNYDDADNTASATIKQLLVIALESGTGTKLVMESGGTLYKSNWGFSPDITKPAFIGVNGAITQTVPTSGYSRVAGVFESASGTAGAFRFAPSPDTVAL